MESLIIHVLYCHHQLPEHGLVLVIQTLYFQTTALLIHDEIMQLFKQLNEEDGVTIIQATHSESNAAYASKIINLLDGSIAKS